MPPQINEIKDAVVTAVNDQLELKADASALELKADASELELKADASALELKADAVALVAAQETIALQGKALDALNESFDEVKNIAADAEAKVASQSLNMDHKNMELQFDTKALNAKLKEVFASGEKADFATIDTKTWAIGGSGNESLAIDEELGRTIIERARENVAILGLIANKSVGSVEYREMVLRTYPGTDKLPKIYLVRLLGL